MHNNPYHWGKGGGRETCYTPNSYNQEYIRRRGECRTLYCRVQTLFEEYRGQVV